MHPTNNEKLVRFLIVMYLICFTVTYGVPDNVWWDDYKGFHDCMSNPNLPLEEKADICPKLPRYKHYRSEMIGAAVIVVLLYFGFGR